MKAKKEKVTFYLNYDVIEFLKKFDNKTEIINSVMEKFIKDQQKHAFFERLQKLKPVKAEISVLEALRKARDED